MFKDKFIGAVVEFNFDEFLVYALVTHSGKKIGHLLRLFKPKFYSVVQDVSSLRSAGYRMDACFPLKYAIKDPEVRIAGHLPLNNEDKVLPVFKSSGLFAPGEKATGWWIIDGEKERWVTALTEEMSHYSQSGLYSYGALKDIFSEDRYPNSPIYLNQGPLAFDPDKTARQ